MAFILAGLYIEKQELIQKSQSNHWEEVHNKPIDPAAKPMTQKKPNSSKSLNGEFRANEICLVI